MNTSPVSPQPAEFSPSITWLNMSGDVTITWDASNIDSVRALVEKKMAEGYSFFIIKPRMLKLLGNKKVALRNTRDLEGATGLVVPDSVMASMVEALGDPDVTWTVAQGGARLASAPRGETARRATSAAEVLANQSVAVRRVVGG